MANGLVKAISFGALIAGVTMANAQISFMSGVPESRDSGLDKNITFLEGSETGSFPTLTRQDFKEARDGSHAYILSGLANGWASSLGNGTGAKWVGCDDYGWNNGYTSHSALYAMSFDLKHSISNADLSLTFTVDDQLGDSNNEGLFMDGKSIAGSTSMTDWNNQIENKSFDLGRLSAGEHTLYFDVNNYGAGPSGIMFSGKIGPQACPEPAPMAVLGLGIFGIARRRKARKA